MARTQGCTDVILEKEMDKALFANCSYANNVVVRAWSRKIDLDSLQFIAGRLTVVSNISTVVNFTNVANVMGSIAVLATDQATVSIDFPLVSQVGGSITLGHPITCNGSLLFRMGHASPSVLIADAVHFFGSSQCTLSALYLANISGLNTNEVNKTALLLQGNNVGTIDLIGHLQNNAIIKGNLEMHINGSLTHAHFTQLATVGNISIHVGSGADIGPITLGMADTPLSHVSVVAVSPRTLAPVSVTNATRIDGKLTLSGGAALSLNGNPVNAGGLIEACSGTGILSLLTHECMCLSRSNTCSPPSLFTTTLDLTGDPALVLYNSSQTLDFSDAIIASLVARGVPLQDISFVEVLPGNTLLALVFLTSKALAMDLATSTNTMPLEISFMGHPYMSYPAAQPSVIKEPGSNPTPALAGAIIGGLVLMVFAAAMISRRFRAQVSSPPPAEAPRAVIDPKLLINDPKFNLLHLAVSNDDLSLLNVSLSQPFEPGLFAMTDLSFLDDFDSPLPPTTLAADYGFDSSSPPVPPGYSPTYASSASAPSPPGLAFGAACSPPLFPGHSMTAAGAAVAPAHMPPPLLPGAAAAIAARSPIPLGPDGHPALSCPPLAWAVCLRNIPAINMLLQNGANIHAVNERKQTALHLACSMDAPDVVAALLHGGADANAADIEMSTPLIYAARLGNVDTAVLLLRARCDVSRPDMRGMTALMYAAAQGFGALVQILVQADPAGATTHDCNGWTALHWATAVRSPLCVCALLDCPVVLETLAASPPDRDTPLHIAARTGNVEVVQLLLARLPFYRARTLLLAVSSKGLTAAQCAMSANQPNCAATLNIMLSTLEGQFRAQVLTNTAATAVPASASSDSDEALPGAAMAAAGPRDAAEEKSLARARRIEYLREHRVQEKASAKLLETKVTALEDENGRLSAELQALRSQAEQLREALAAQRR